MAFGTCDNASAQKVSPLPGRAARVADLAQKYASFEAETPSGKLVFKGEGAITATPWEQRAMAEWASLVYAEANSGRTGAAWGLALTYSRQGGIAGFCDTLTVYLDGEALVSSCKGNQSGGGKTIWLSSNQLHALYTWVDGLKSFDYQHKDPAVADAMTVQLMLAGTGKVDNSEADVQAMAGLAQDLLGQARVTPDAAGMESARQTLQGYLEALAAKDYNRAAGFYGGDYQTLIDMNPDRDPADHLGLLETGCTNNGFVCNLNIKNIVEEAQLSPTDFRITVELQNPDGSLFSLGPCCGASPEEEPPVTQFDFRVENSNGTFQVMDLPVYVP
jgi:hypothetical protein